MIYLAYCTKCGKQGVGSTENYEPRLSNYKSQIAKESQSCSIVKHFIDSCADTVNPSIYLRFILMTTLLTPKIEVKKKLIIYFQKKRIFSQEHYAQYIRVLTIIMIGDRSEGIKRLTSVTGKNSNKTCLDIPRIRLFLAS